jgi:dienelactone hydrolase
VIQRRLAKRGEIDPARIGVLGMCQGASEMIAVAAEDENVRAVALVSGQYLYRENLLGFFGGGDVIAAFQDILGVRWAARPKASSLSL